MAHAIPQPSEWQRLDATAWRERVLSPESSAEAGVTAALELIATHNPRLGAFSVVLGEPALAQARSLDRLAAAPGFTPGPLHGVPLAVKEEDAVAGCVTTFGTAANRTPATADAEVVRRLREAGAIIIGKTQMPEFGAWPFTESGSFGITRNPYDLDRTPGGSSGGSAAAVAAGLVPAAIGGDGGGSIRIPSAHCGLFGLKPQRGRVSTAPAEHLWWALGTIGPLTKTVRDSALIYDAISGALPTDRFPAAPIGPLVESLGSRQRLRMGWTTRASSPLARPHREHVRGIEDWVGRLRGVGHDVRPLGARLPEPTLVFLVQFFAGIRSEARAMEHYAALEPRTRRLNRLGGWVTDGVLQRSLRGGERLTRRAEALFEDFDLLITPTTASRPARAGILIEKGAVAALAASVPSVAYTSLWNVTGHPAAAIPIGTGEDGLPVSLQVIAPAGREDRIIALAAEIEELRAAEG